VENAGEGNDRVLALADFRLSPGAHVELIAALDAAGTLALNLAGNELDNIIFGNEGANLLEGEGGDDHLVGRGGDDRLMGGDGRDYLEGRAGDDELDGGPGADVMAGGAGDDIYHVDHDSDGLIENIGGGHDVAMLAFGAFARFTLAPGAEIEEIVSSPAMRGVSGNDFGQVIQGNDTFNELWGGGGDDQLFAFAGDDWVWGGPGADLMDGGTGNDWYEIDDDGDTIVEAVGNGFDRVTTYVDYQLPDGVEVELIHANMSTDALSPFNFTGNEFGQFIFGTNGVNTLLGMGGDDTLVGGLGEDLLDGGPGNDILWGDEVLDFSRPELLGQDMFRFTAALGPGNVDTILSFQVGFDRVLLDHAAFAGLTPGALPAGAFRNGAAAADADDRIIFDAQHESLYFDPDGSGPEPAVMFAGILLSQKSLGPLSASDFTVI
jgi:Ca2+-binding RTX toxin-like protein